MDRQERIAVVGLGALFAGAADVDALWANIRDRRDQCREVPPGRWALAPEDAYDPAIAVADKVYSLRGCFLDDFDLDSSDLDLPPGLIDRLDPVFRLALHAGRQAWRDAVTGPLDRRRVGVILGNIALPTETT